MDVLEKLEEAISSIENDEQETAESILQETSDYVRTLDRQISEYPNVILATKLQMAKSDVKLSRTKILEKLISDIKSYSEPTKE